LAIFDECPTLSVRQVSEARQSHVRAGGGGSGNVEEIIAQSFEVL